MRRPATLERAKRLITGLVQCYGRPSDCILRTAWAQIFKFVFVSINPRKNIKKRCYIKRFFITGTRNKVSVSLFTFKTKLHLA